MTVAVIVQARTGSSRLPGKVMKDLAGQTVLHHVLQRCSQIENADIVVCAMPDERESASLERVARECGAAAFHGSEKDVLARYAGAARAVNADIVMRVTSDCPLIDPEICAAVIALLKTGNADYAANNMPRSYPHGLDCEAFTFAALAKADREAQEAHDREHVTPWLRRAANIKRANLDSGRAGLADYRWTLDYPEDLDFFRAVFAELPSSSRKNMGDVLTLLSAHPEIAKINAMRHLTSA